MRRRAGEAWCVSIGIHGAGIWAMVQPSKKESHASHTAGIYPQSAARGPTEFAVAIQMTVEACKPHAVKKLTFQCSLVGGPVTSPRFCSPIQSCSSTMSSGVLCSAAIAASRSFSCKLSSEPWRLLGGVSGPCRCGRSVGRKTAGT